MKKTFFDKWKEEHPGPHVGMGYPPDCPCSYGYEKESKCEENYRSCAVCWNREMPEEEKADKKTIYAHMGFSEEQAEAIEKLNEGKMTPNEVRETFGLPKILDSGARREFGTGAVRDIQEGKGRCDLLPLDVVCEYYYDIGLDIAFSIFELIGYFKTTANHVHLIEVLKYFCEDRWDKDCNSMFLEVSIHFEEGAKKYGENNWQKGIPVHCYIDSAVRHYLKFLRGDKDEPHDRAFCWNIMCAIWTCKHKPELNDYAQRDTSEVEEALG